MKLTTGYLDEIPHHNEWCEAGVAIAVDGTPVHIALLDRLERIVRDSPALALATQYSNDAEYWRYRSPLIVNSQRVLLLRRDTRQGREAAIEAADVLADDIADAVRAEAGVSGKAW